MATENPMLVYAILKSRRKFEALRAFTLESGQQEIERMARRRKEILNGADSSPDHGTSETIRSPTSRTSSHLSNVPEEEGTFAIGGDDSDEEVDGHNAHDTPTPSSPSLHNSRTPSISSSIDDSVPVQLRGMSEKARGKMPAGLNSFSRQSSTTNLSAYSMSLGGSHMGFNPTPEWVSSTAESRSIECLY